MNNSFDIHRFGKLVWHDVRRCSPVLGTVGGTMLGLLAFTPLTTMLQGATGLEQDASYRLALMTTMTFFLASTVPTQLYANIGPKRKRGDVYFALLPASKLEKYLSIAVLSLVLVPVVLMVCNVAIDTLLTAVHAPFYSLYLWQSEVMEMLTLPMLCNGVLVFVGSTLGFIYVNCARTTKWRFVLSFVLWLWLMGGMILPIFIDSTAMQWALVGVQAVFAALAAIVSWNKMNKMGY